VCFYFSSFVRVFPAALREEGNRVEKRRRCCCCCCCFCFCFFFFFGLFLVSRCLVFGIVVHVFSFEGGW
jgi:hypothetical protein